MTRHEKFTPKASAYVTGMISSESDADSDQADW